ncbi:MAG TPA: FAD-dependent oxidoreductase [Chitinophagaceae bacterium]|nr:FAD-dependent oxidoreductase [Chitinophagaceae bacterium]
MARVTIVGGGVIGLCSAYYLQKKGHEVTVIDKTSITDGCSFGNMGYISPSHFIPLASPGIIAKGLRWMLSSSSPFYIKPRLNLDLLQWGLIFWRSSNAKTVEKNATHLNNLLQLSRELMKDIKNEYHDSFEMIERGCWMLYKSQATGEHEKQLAEKAQMFGLKTEICSSKQVQEYEPDVEVNVAGGILYLDDCHINPTKFMHDLHANLSQKGVKFLLNTEIKFFEKNNSIVSSAITTNGKVNFDELVIATGSWLPEVAKLLGIKIILQPGKGYSFINDNLEKNLRYPSILVDDRTATAPIHHWLRIGGTMELSGHSKNILPKRVEAIYHAFKKYYPSLPIKPPTTENTWFGYRPVSPDGMPYIGRHTKYSNVTIAGGHAMLGVSAAAGTGKLIQEIIQKEKTIIDIKAFSPERY